MAEAAAAPRLPPPPAANATTTSGPGRADRFRRDGGIGEEGLEHAAPRAATAAADTPARSGGLQEQLNRELAPLLDAAEALGRDPESAETFPRIVVVGDQSDGKSTVLEAISKVRFPRSSGLCTRCPIQLSLRRSEESKLTASYHFSGKPQIKHGNVEDFNRIIGEIQDDLTKGLSVDISDELIEVSIQTPDSFDLTLIDLPGINRQDKPLEDKTVQIIQQYIQCRQTIIIVVFKATTDIQSVKGFQLAKEVDKTGERTFGVMTFCDALTDSTEENVARLLSGQTPKGIIFKAIYPVSCSRYSTGGVEAEEQELSKRVVFQRLPEEKRGTRSLTMRLSKEVLERLRPWTKRIVGLVKEKYAQCQQQLKNLQRGHPTEEEDSRTVACGLLQEMITEISQHITGCHIHEKNELYSDCRDEFEKYRNAVLQIAKQSADKLEEDIKREWSKQRGREFALAANIFPVMERIIRNLIVEYEGPTASMRDVVFQLIREHMEQTTEKVFSEYPQLKNFVFEKLDALFSARKEKTFQRLDEILETEQSIVFTLNAEFSKNLKWNPEMGSQSFARQTLQRSEGEDRSTEAHEEADEQKREKSALYYDEQRLLHLTESYLGIVKNRVVDTVCMALLKCLNHGIAKDLKSFHRILDEANQVHSLMRDPERENKLRQARVEAEKWRRQEENLARLIYC